MKSKWGSTQKKFQNVCKYTKAKYLNKNIETPQISMYEPAGVKRFLCLDFYLLDWRESIPDKWRDSLQVWRHYCHQKPLQGQMYNWGENFREKSS